MKRTGLQRVTYVYFIQCNGEEGPVKIGYSSDVVSRIRDLQVGSPYPITLLGKFKCDNPSDFEASLHSLFSDLHIRGEWFRWTPAYRRLLAGMLEIEAIAGTRDLQVRIVRKRRG